jgi:hypothetical protein
MNRRFFAGATIALGSLLFSSSAFAVGPGQYMFHEYDDHGPHVLYVFDKDGTLLGPVRDKGGDLSWGLGNPNANSDSTALDNRLITADVEKNSDGTYTLKSFNLQFQKTDSTGKPIGSLKEVEITSVRLASVHGGEDTETFYKTKDGKSLSDQSNKFVFGEPASKPLQIPADAPLPPVREPAPQDGAADEYMFHEFRDNGPELLYLYDKDGKLLGPVSDKSGDLSWALGDPNADGTALDSRLVTAKVEKNPDGSYTIKSFTMSYQKLDAKGKPEGSLQEVEVTSVSLKNINGGEDTGTYYKTADGKTISDQSNHLEFGRPAPKPLDIPADAKPPVAAEASTLDRIKARGAEESKADRSTLGMSGLLDDRMKDRTKGDKADER